MGNNIQGGITTNIFFLDPNLELNAQYHVDSHVVKMCIEYTQILSTASRYVGLEQGYKSTHINHPCNIWARESIYNWVLLREMTKELGKEFTYRFGGYHRSVYIASNLKLPPIPDKGLTRPALAMPDLYKSEDVFKAYRDYYRCEKRHIARWSKRSVPEWFKIE